MTSLDSISDYQDFIDWVKKFSDKQGYVCSAGKEKSDAIKQPIKNTFEKVMLIDVTIETVEVLKLNIFRACYLALKTLEQAQKQGQEYNAGNRLELQTFLSQLPEWLKSIKSLGSLISHYRYLSAIAITETENSNQVRVPPKESLKQLQNLQTLLDNLEAGLLDFKDVENHVALISGSDFAYGPFDFSIDLNKEWKSKGVNSLSYGKNIIETGLMFHLTYLFRYFSTSEPPQTFTSSFNGDILVIDSVKMLKTGKPNHHLVANFINAVFDTKYSSEDVQDRLKSLLKPKDNSKIAPVFIGW